MTVTEVFLSFLEYNKNTKLASAALGLDKINSLAAAHDLRPCGHVETKTVLVVFGSLSSYSRVRGEHHLPICSALFCVASNQGRNGIKNCLGHF